MTQLIVALDVPSHRDAVALVDSFQGKVSWVKVGLELFVSAGPPLIADLRSRGLEVMLDLKLHDIPETVGRTVAVMADMGVGMITVHAQGGPKMLEAARKASAERLKILAVTVLTSLDEEDLVVTGHDPTPHKTLVHDLAFRLFTLAKRQGVDGVVCSPWEVKALWMNLDHGHVRPMLFVTPGIRLDGDAKGDQKRVATPEAAKQAGADFIVVGRPIRDAPDRLAVIERIGEAIR